MKKLRIRFEHTSNSIRARDGPQPKRTRARRSKKAAPCNAPGGGPPGGAIGSERDGVAASSPSEAPIDGTSAAAPVESTAGQQQPGTSDRATGLVTHAGQCHCGAVKFEFDAAPDLVAWDCDCSICSVKRNTHAIVPETRFRLLQGEGSLSCYQFNTKTAKHLFCKTCGVCPFYRPRSNPDGFAVTVHCITSPTVKTLTIKSIRGSDWEASVAASGIQSLSKA